MSAFKKQHFIPQFLLKQFAQGKKDKEKLWTFDKKSGKSFFAAVRDTGHENNFYDGANPAGEPIEAESLMQYVDGIGSVAYSTDYAGAEISSR